MIDKECDIGPCPFCNHYETSEIEEVKTDDKARSWIRVHCLFCGARGPEFIVYKNRDDAIRRSIDSWNNICFSRF